MTRENTIFTNASWGQSTFWECTPRLRWVERNVGQTWQGNAVLQQAWKSSEGEVEWRDVPVEKEDL